MMSRAHWAASLTEPISSGFKRHSSQRNEVKKSLERLLTLFSGLQKHIHACICTGHWTRVLTHINTYINLGHTRM